MSKLGEQIFAVKELDLSWRTSNMFTSNYKSFSKKSGFSYKIFKKFLARSRCIHFFTSFTRCRYSVQIFDPEFWSRFSVRIFYSDFRSSSFCQFCVPDFRTRFAVPIFGQIFSVQFFGQDFRTRLLVKIFGPEFWFEKMFILINFEIASIFL